MESRKLTRWQAATGRSLTSEVRPIDTIEDVKIKLQEKEDVPPDHQLVSFSGALVEGDSTSINDPPTDP